MVGAVVALLVVRSGPTVSGTTVPGEASSPERAASAFLDSVSAGRADDALAFLHDPPRDRVLLTDAVLAESMRLAPVTQVTASVREGGASDWAAVDVAYRIGGQRVTDTYDVVRVGKYWFVHETLPVMPLFLDHPDGVAVTVDGAVATGDIGGSSVLPGRYRLGLDNPLLEVEAAEVTVIGLHGPITTSGPHARLTDAGRRKVAAAAAETLDGCLTATTLDSTCGLTRWDAPDTTRLAAGTATGSLLPGSTDLVTTTPDWHGCRDEPLSGAVCADGIYVAMSVVTATTDGGTESFLVQIVGYTADISDPDHVRITFAGT